MKKILAVDGNSIINRAFYGIKLLDNGKGLYTNAIFGLINIINKNIDSVKPDICIAAFDLSAPTFRHKMYAEYKAGRKKMPDELRMQIPYAKKVLSALGFLTLELEGYEADDILGTVAKTGEKGGYETYILTGDRDSLQLIDDHTKVLLVKNSETVSVDRTNFSDIYPVDLSVFVDLKALMGDSSDNIPGVPGIGEKTAAKLLSDFGSLEGIFESYADSDLTPSVKKKLEAGKESAFISRELATINREVPLTVSLSDAEFTGINKSEAYALFKELGFSKFIDKYNLSGEDADEISTESLPEFPAELTERPLSDADPKGCYVVSLDEGLFKAFNGEILYSTDDVFEMNIFLTFAEVYAADSKLFYHELEKLGIKYRNVSFDCVLAAYVIDSNIEYTKDKVFELYDAANHPEEAVRVFSVVDKLKSKLTECSGESLLYNIEIPLSGILTDMECVGFKLDTEALREYGNGISEKIKSIEGEIYVHAGREFNVNSPKQLGEVLFEEIGLPAQKKTKSGYSTNAEILDKLKNYHPIIPLILEYRKLVKLKGTYVEGLLSAADSKGKIHTVFKQAATATGRLSSAEPNLQNIPVKTEEGRILRKFFVTENSENVLIDADYSQIELRLLASISGDEDMCEAFNMGADIHTATAATVFGVPFDEVTPLQRKRAKAVNFGIMYGMGDFSLSNDLGIPIKEAKKYIENYLANYPSITEYFENTNRSAYEKGYVSTMFGRRRYIPELSASNRMVKAFGERVARNSPIQGSAADIIKIAMINVSKRLSEECPDAKIILQVHDELLLEVPLDKARLASEILKEEMENAVSLNVKLSVETGIGKTWFDCK